ncbi:hypothetical protein [Mycobacterium gordonae]|uniref:Uncharacterized protein n=1 Tax=Mycobacterium gordonae TaxID=1778 RepID=A0A1X1W1U4_MYCGO|nr:hypothetical protein [Mycobacterium gordonae]MCV7007435.1 hypothetical protein [Mycobacterium gordonae]ODR16066.1 hypothetical protein BHQ23_31235 [Mycobacterium gordonae]ORV80221.1 hypothetical protein AWC08_30355 [Mycobacterium gordonae]
MITVKTYPNPSETYGETVCVAGVRLDRGQPEWIRLYPVKFRNADFDSQFKKYEIIRVNGTYHQANDNRPESFRPRQDELVHVERLDTSSNWQRRRMILDGLIGATTMCELLDANPIGGMGKPSPSLGLIKPVDVSAIVVDGEPWTAEEQAKINNASVPDLFGTSLTPLEPAPYAVRFRYRCASANCKGHDQKVLDWEAGQAGRRWLKEYGDAGAREALLTKWRDEMLSPDRDFHFYVGNQNRRRRSFSVLGVWYPKIEDTLF